MSTTWIVAADAGRARIFEETDPTSPLRELEVLSNPAARLHDSEIHTDQGDPKAAGKSINNTGGPLPTSQYQPNQTPEEHNAELFARQVLARLLEAKQQQRFDQLELIADPKFLGLLRKYMDPGLKSAVCQEINKDLTHSTGQQLKEQLRLHGRPGA